MLHRGLYRGMHEGRTSRREASDVVCEGGEGASCANIGERVRRYDSNVSAGGLVVTRRKARSSLSRADCAPVLRRGTCTFRYRNHAPLCGNVT